jgi:hypothetical protein
MQFKQFLETNQGIKAYHGSRTSGLSNLRGGMPPYEGGIGRGVYLGLYPQTAEFYGNHVYEVITNFDWDAVLSIGNEENYEPIEDMEGHSILIGEHIPPFAFRVKNKSYVVVTGRGWPQEDQHPMGEPISLEDIGDVVQEAGYRAVYVVGIRYGSSVNEEMLVFDQNDVRIIRQVS